MLSQRLWSLPCRQLRPWRSLRILRRGVSGVRCQSTVAAAWRVEKEMEGAEARQPAVRLRSGPPPNFL